MIGLTQSAKANEKCQLRFCVEKRGQSIYNSIVGFVPAIKGKEFHDYV